MDGDEKLPERQLERTEVVSSIRRVAGKYTLGRQIGEGGMGAVYEAEHVGLGTRVAVKLLGESLADNPTFVKRFQREARAAAAVQHENVVTVTDTGTDEDSGVPYIVMEYLHGESLSAILRRQRILTPQATAEISAQILRGLAVAHDQNVIHRDLKPGNIFLAKRLDGSSRAKILDFGISKFVGVSVGTNVTVDGTIVGTPNFMAPEQVTGNETIDRRADLYAVGVMMYRMLTGKLPYAGASSQEVYEKILEGRPLHPRHVREGIPDALCDVVMKAMATRRRDRYNDAKEFLEGLHAAVPSLGSHASQLSLSDLPAVNTDRYRSDPPSAEDVGAGIGAQAETVPEPRPSSARPPTSKTTTALWIFAAVALLAAGAGGYFLWLAADSSATTMNQGHENVVVPTGPVLRFGVKHYASRDVIETEHTPLVNYLQERLDRPVKLSIHDEWIDLSEELQSGRLQLAALSAYTYVRSQSLDSPPRLLATAVLPGGPFYVGHIVTRMDSGVDTLEALKGRAFCYVGPTSTSGYLYPRAIFRRAGLDPDHDFSSTRFAGDHLSALKALQAGACDGAAVYQDILFQADEHGIHGLRSLATTDRIPYDAYCASASMGEEETRALRDALLELRPGSPTAVEVLSSAPQLRGFVPGEDEDYSTVRSILRYLSQDDESANNDPSPGEP